MARSWRSHSLALSLLLGTTRDCSAETLRAAAPASIGSDLPCSRRGRRLGWTLRGPVPRQSGQSGSVAAGALDTPGPGATQLLTPFEQTEQPSTVSVDCLLVQPSAQRVYRNGDMGVFVDVDADDDLAEVDSLMHVCLG